MSRGIEGNIEKVESPSTKQPESLMDRIEANTEVEKPNSVKEKEAVANYTKNIEGEKYPSTYGERIAHVPRDDGTRGKWNGVRGESNYMPNDTEASNEIKKYGKDGVEYKNGIPDFSPFAKEKVEISNMQANRSDTFRKADKACAEQWNKKGVDNKTDWTRKDIETWRDKNNYTWHECNDRKTCQLVPTSIHSNCGHLGGFSECKKAESQN